MECKLFTRPYCGRQLSWWVLKDECDPNKAPDIICQDDPTFSPLTAADVDSSLLQLLKGWSSSSRVDSLIGVLLVLYAQHNKALIAAAVTDERILFELSMLDGLGCQEVLLTGEHVHEQMQTHHIQTFSVCLFHTVVVCDLGCNYPSTFQRWSGSPTQSTYVWQATARASGGATRPTTMLCT